MRILARPIPSSLEVKVINSEKTLYKGIASVVSAVNESGTFDILPGHRSFISIVSKSIIISLENEEKLKFNIGKGVIKCANNKINIMVGLESV